MHVSRKAASFTESVIREMTRLAIAGGAVNLAQGYPDFPCPPELKQRIGMLCSIPTMSRTASRNYIRTRLRLAGARDLAVFSDEALNRITDYAQGIPRVVNTVYDHCLVIGYADQTRRIPSEVRLPFGTRTTAPSPKDAVTEPSSGPGSAGASMRGRAGADFEVRKATSAGRRSCSPLRRPAGRSARGSRVDAAFRS